MNMYIEINGGRGVDFFYGNIEWEKGELKIKRHQGLYKVLEYSIKTKELRMRRTKDGLCLSNDKIEIMLFDAEKKLKNYLCKIPAA